MLKLISYTRNHAFRVWPNGTRETHQIPQTRKSKGLKNRIKLSCSATSYLKLGPKDKLGKGRGLTGKRGGREAAQTRRGKLVVFFHEQPQSPHSVTRFQQLTSNFSLPHRKSILYQSERLATRPTCFSGKILTPQSISNSMSTACIPLFQLAVAVFIQKTQDCALLAQHADTVPQPPRDSLDS